MLKYKYIIWDWNGTLLNDIGASLASVNDMLAARGREPIDIVYYKECISVPIIGFYEKVFDMEKEDLEQFYPEFDEYRESCRFNGCSHTHEPGCQVKAAIEEGNISKERYENYKLIYEEVKNRKKY